MKVRELETDPAIQEWFASLSPGDATKQVYLYSMQEYTEHTGLSPIELIEEAEEEIQAGILPRKRKIRAYMLGFKQALIKKRLSDFTIRSRLTGVRSFYKAAYIEIPAQLSDRRRPMTIKENDQVPKKSDIRDVLKVADPLEKAVVLTGVSAGLPSNEIRKLRISDFKKGKNPETGITTLDLRRFKARVDFITFLTPEATAAIDEYLVYRDREAKAPTARRKRQLENQRVVSDDGFLFILRQIPPEYAETGDENLRQLTENAIIKLYGTLAEKANKNTKIGTYNYIRSHAMRKFFSNALRDNGAPYLFVEQCLGHKVTDTEKAYSEGKTDVNENIYQKFIQHLTITETYDPTGDPGYQKLKENNDALSRVIELTAEERKKDSDRVAVLEAELEQFRADAAAQAAENARQNELLAELKAMYLPENKGEIRKLVRVPGVMDEAVNNTLENDEGERGN